MSGKLENSERPKWVKKAEIQKAIQRTTETRLWRFDYDNKGLRIPGSKRLFNIFASPSDFGAESEGLGAYFQVLRAFILIMLVYSVLATYTTITFWRDGNRYSPVYRLEIFDTDGRTSLGSVDCSKFWAVSNAFSRYSLGTFCQPNSLFTNPVNCPAVCKHIVPDSPVSTPNATADVCLRDPIAYYKSGASPSLPPKTEDFLDSLSRDGKLNESAASFLCYEHLPCARRFDHGHDAPDGSCNCCTLENTDRVGTVAGILEPRFQMWQFYLLLILFFLSQVGLKVRLEWLSRKLDAGKTSAGDFTVVVSGLPFARGEEAIGRLTEDLTEYSRHFGDVVCVAPMLDLGEILTLAEQLDDLYNLRLEIQGRQTYGAERGFFGCLFYLMYRRRDAEKALAEIEKDIKGVAEDIARFEKRSPQRTVIGSFLVTFATQQAAEKFIRDHRVGFFGSLVLGIPFLGPVLNDACLALKPTFKHEGRLYLLEAERASEPDDVNWQATSSYGFTRLLRDNAADVIAALCILLGAALQFGLEFVTQIERDRLTELQTTIKTSEGILAQTKKKNLTPADGLAFLKANRAQIQTQAVSVACSLAVVAINMLLAIALRLTIKLEAKGTRTAQQTSLLWKLSLAYIINSFVVPVVAALLTESSRLSWYSVGGLASEAVSIQLSNALLPPLLSLIDPMRILKRVAFPSYARSQELLLKLLDGEEFLIAERLASNVKTLALGILFAPIMPLSSYIALGALVIAYYSDKNVVIAQAKAPAEMKISAVSTVHAPMAAIQLIMQVFCGLVFFRHRGHQATRYLLIAVVTWGGLYFLPWGQLTARILRRFGAQVSDNDNETTYFEALQAGGDDPENFSYAPVLPEVGVSDELKLYLEKAFTLSLQPALGKKLRGQADEATVNPRAFSTAAGFSGISMARFSSTRPRGPLLTPPSLEGMGGKAEAEAAAAKLQKVTIIGPGLDDEPDNEHGKVREASAAASPGTLASGAKSGLPSGELGAYTYAMASQQSAYRSKSAAKEKVQLF